MPQRVFKRKFNGKSIRNLESSTEAGEIKESMSNSTELSTENTVPNRIFVGGISANVTEWDIKQKFSNYGNVRAAKIIRDQMGISKGYGFVTFNMEEEAKKALEKGETVLKGRKLNIAPAVRKHNFNSATQLNNEICSIETSLAPTFHDYRSSEKRNYTDFKHSLENSMPSTNVAYQPYICDTSGTYMESGQYYGVADMPYIYGNPQMNFSSYPTLVYVPQQAFHCSGATNSTYHFGTTLPEIIQLIPAPICCINEQK